VPALERLGESKAGPGYLLLEMLALSDWSIVVNAHPDGVLVSASKLGRRTVAIPGPSVAEVASTVVTRAVDQDREARRHGD